MLERLGHAFFTIIRPIDGPEKMLESDPYRPFRVSPDAKRIVTFLRDAPTSKPNLPIEQDDARILLLKGTRRVQRLSADAQGSGLHDPARQGVWQGRDDSHLGHCCEGRARVRFQDI